VDSPFLSPGLPRDEEGFFVTGDRACKEAEGRFDLLGRVDGIVKVGGKRVALEGVEARIKALPFIRDAYVLSLSSRSMREAEIVCLVVPEREGCPEDLREFLGSILEPSELPRRVLRVQQIPLTPAGKRDRERAERLLSGT
jgi:acyl-coenzyme A synthetase/AMP-(fatty) acid ligase